MTDLGRGERWIDDVADRFEAAWRAGPRPRIEDFLGGNPADGLAALLEELVCVDVHCRRQAGEEPAVAEYLARFPDHPPAVEAGFLAAVAPGPARETEPAPEPVGAQILLGILALQHTMIGREALLAAFRDWVGDKSRGLGEVLVDRGALTAVRLALLETLTALTLEQYGGDLDRGLASRGALGAIRGDLERLRDADVDATLTGLTAGASETTRPGPSPRRGGRPAPPRPPRARFRLIEKINGGGQGDIYLAMDEALNREVALKRIKGRYASCAEFQARLLVEAEVAARLEHPAFLPVHSVGFDAEGRPYFVMRHIRGDGNFRGRIDEFHAPGGAARPPGERAQGLRKLLRHFVDVCYAVAYAHDRGVIHRDIKPENVLLGQFGETYLVDWGMVKFVERPASAGPRPDEPLRPSPGRVPAFTLGGGTLPYMSPEQVAGRPIDRATDIYSLGVLLYVLMTGKPAFTGEDRAEIEAKIEGGRFDPPRSVDARVPAALEAVCLKAMRLRPEERYATAKEIAQDVEDWLADRPIEVYPEPWALRARRWARDHKPVVAGLGALLIASVLYLLIHDALLRVERAKTEANFALARDAVLRLLHATSVPPKSPDDHREIAAMALRAGRVFLESRPGDRGVGLEAARTYRATANMGRAVGEFEGPLALYRGSSKLLDRIRARSPADPAVTEERALNAIDTGELWLLNGRPARSKGYFEGVLEDLDAPDGRLTVAQRRVKALALVNLATARNETDDPRRARTSAMEVVDLLATPGAEALDGPEAGLSLMLAQIQAGIAEGLLGNDQGSEEWWSRAVAKGEALLKDEHDTPDIKHALARALNHQAERYAARPDRREEALKKFQKAGQILFSLVNEHPHVRHFHRDMAITYIGRIGLFPFRVPRDITDPKRRLGFYETAEEELKSYDASRGLFDYHRHSGRILAHRARLAREEGDFESARRLFDRAAEAHGRAIGANPDSRIDRLLLEGVSRERDALR